MANDRKKGVRLLGKGGKFPLKKPLMVSSYASIKSYYSVYNQISMCAMRRSAKKGIVKKSGDYMVVVINYEAEYNTVVEKAAKVLGLQAETCSLVHTNGSRIVNEVIVANGKRHTWCIGKYIESIYARTSAVRLGLFPEDECLEVQAICTCIPFSLFTLFKPFWHIKTNIMFIIMYNLFQNLCDEEPNPPPSKRKEWPYIIYAMQTSNRAQLNSSV